MKLLLTGIAGFIGSHLAERLLARGDTIVGLDNFDGFYARYIKERNLAAIDVELHEADIRDADALDRVFNAHRFDAVLHFAALAGVRPSIAHAARYQDVNVVGTGRVLEAMLKHGVGRVVFASSSSVYGNNAEVPFREEHRVDAPASPYAASKRAGELLLRSFGAVHGVSSVSLRFFTVYGPRQRPEMAIHSFARHIDAGSPVTLFGDGSTSRDYTYVDDIIDGCVGAIDSVSDGIYNLGNTEPVVLADLVARIGSALGREVMVERAAPQPGDVSHTWASIDAAAADFGYRPKVGIDEGLRRFVAWLRAQPAE